MAAVCAAVLALPLMLAGCSTETPRQIQLQLKDRVEAFLLSCGVTAEEIASVRAIMLE